MYIPFVSSVRLFCACFLLRVFLSPLLAQWPCGQIERQCSTKGRTRLLTQGSLQVMFKKRILVG